MPKHIFLAFTLGVGEGTEYWYGLESIEGEDLSHIEKEFELIPADGMTEDELSIIRKWEKTPGAKARMQT